MANHIDELAWIEFRGSLGEAFLDYGEVLEELGRQWKFELELAAGEAEAAIASLKGHWYLVGVDTKWKARQIAKRLKRMQEMADGIESHGRRFHGAYRKHFLGR
ncbi:hypothetical protein SMC26_30065 [Actinomadura fulvescens]|uniref:Uncharacterized protein n=1 Tax=Actinomadura fulvescens TaxID=46160 RepID=A0ABN3PAZ5_9ACTN